MTVFKAVQLLLGYSIDINHIIMILLWLRLLLRLAITIARSLYLRREP